MATTNSRFEAIPRYNNKTVIARSKEKTQMHPVVYINFQGPSSEKLFHFTWSTRYSNHLKFTTRDNNESSVDSIYYD